MLYLVAYFGSESELARMLQRKRLDEAGLEAGVPHIPPMQLGCC